MRTVYDKLTADVISSAALCGDYLDQVSPVAISPSFVMDQTARAGP